MDGIDWSATSMQAAQRRLEISADNLANEHTAGFAAHVARVTATAHGLQTFADRDAAPAALKPTGRDWDIAVVGNGSLHVANLTSPSDVVAVRGGHFVRDPEGRVIDEHGRGLLGANGFLRVPEGAVVEPDGRVMAGNKCVALVPIARGAKIERGVTEVSNVDSVGEMVRILEAQRTFETSEKVLSAIDATRQKAVTDVGEVKS